MGILTPTAAKGLTQFESAAPWRAHDDAADKKVSGAYSHEPKEFSATECDEQVSFQMFLQALLKAALGAIPCRCAASLAKGDLVYVSAFDAANQAFTVAKADGADPDKPAQFVMHAALGANTNGYAYTCGDLSGLDTSGASAAGAAVYLSAVTPGAWTTTAPAGGARIVGYCKAKDATTGKISFFPGGLAFPAPPSSSPVRWAMVYAPPTSIGQGNFSTLVSVSYLDGGYGQNLSNANGDNWSFEVAAPGGTYRLDLSALKHNAAPILKIEVDGVQVANQDLYNPTNAELIISATGIKLLPGKHTIKLTANGKNGSSGGYYMLVHGFQLTRTGD